MKVSVSNTLKLIGILVLITPALLLLYKYYPITKERIVGTYEIDTNFYPGANAKWQKQHFKFKITEDDKFLFYEKLRDGSYKITEGEMVWYRNSSPMLFRINIDSPHPLIDTYPGLYRGNRKFYYVFESKFGNMFYRKIN